MIRRTSFQGFWLAAGLLLAHPGLAQTTLGPPPAPPAMVGGLQVIVNVAESKVYLNGQFKGVLTPPNVLNIPDLPAGTVQVKVEAAGYQTRALNFVIQAGVWTQALFVLQKPGSTPAGATLPVPAGGNPPPVEMPKSDAAPASGAGQAAQGGKALSLKVGSTSFEFVLAPAGKFRMGSPSGSQNEMPVHVVTFAKPFWIGKHPVTQRQWREVMGYNPSRFKDAGPEAPVENVSWNACDMFVRRLNEKQSEWIFRLPTEAEWEYACKAGTTGAHYGGSLHDIAWFSVNSAGTTHPVGQKQPNAWGLYDMLGNVWQWCQDFQHDDYEKAPSDGTIWIDGTYYYNYGTRWSIGDRYFEQVSMLRGGSWNSDTEDVRSAKREKALASTTSKDIGFRLVCVPK